LFDCCFHCVAVYRAPEEVIVATKVHPAAGLTIDQLTRAMAAAQPPQKSHVLTVHWHTFVAGDGVRLAVRTGRRWLLALTNSRGASVASGPDQLAWVPRWAGCAPERGAITASWLMAPDVSSRRPKRPSQENNVGRPGSTRRVRDGRRRPVPRIAEEPSRPG
jgi:hypothetical protein